MQCQYGEEGNENKFNQLLKHCVFKAFAYESDENLCQMINAETCHTILLESKEVA